MAPFLVPSVVNVGLSCNGGSKMRRGAGGVSTRISDNDGMLLEELDGCSRCGGPQKVDPQMQCGPVMSAALYIAFNRLNVS